MQVNRLFEIVYILLNRESVTAKELAERFEVSTRTIYRDLDTLSGAGIPVYTTKGVGGGIKLLERCTLNKSILSEEEQSEVLMGLQTLKGARYPDAHQVIEKLGSLFDKVQEDWIEVDFSHWGSPKEEKDKFTIIKKGIINNQCLQFEYLSSYGEKTLRIVEPLKMTFKGQNWYVQAFCRNKEAYRTFKITRMRQVQLLEDEFEIKQILLPTIDKQVEEVRPEEWIQLKLHFNPNMAFRVFDQFEEEDVSLLKDGSLEVNVRYPRGEWVWSYLLSFGDQVTVIEPLEIKEQLRQQAHAILKKYSY